MSILDSRGQRASSGDAHSPGGDTWDARPRSHPFSTAGHRHLLRPRPWARPAHHLPSLLCSHRPEHSAPPWAQHPPPRTCWVQLVALALLPTPRPSLPRGRPSPGQSFLASLSLRFLIHKMGGLPPTQRVQGRIDVRLRQTGSSPAGCPANNAGLALTRYLICIQSLPFPQKVRDRQERAWTWELVRRGFNSSLAPPQPCGEGRFVPLPAPVLWFPVAAVTNDHKHGA